MQKLRVMVPNVRALKVNLGKWRPQGDENDPRRIPKAEETLMKAALWTDPAFGAVRSLLASPPLQLDVTETSDTVKVDTIGGKGCIQVLRKESGFSQELASLPYAVVILDARALSPEEPDLLSNIPGRQLFVNVTLCILGAIDTTEEVYKSVLESTDGQWCGTSRRFDVYTDESDMEYTVCKRQLIVMVPADQRAVKMPKLFLLQDAPSVLVGWTAVLGLMRSMWTLSAVDPKEMHKNVDWLYVVSNDNALPVSLLQRLDAKPSILYCAIGSSLSCRETAATIAETLKTTQESLPLHWGKLLLRAEGFQRLFEAEPDSDQSETETSGPEEEKTHQQVPKSETPKKAAGKRKSFSVSSEDEGNIFEWEPTPAKKDKKKQKQEEKSESSAKSKEKATSSGKKGKEKEREKEQSREREDKKKKRKKDKEDSPVPSKKREESPKVRRGRTTSDLNKRLGARYRDLKPIDRS